MSSEIQNENILLKQGANGLTCEILCPKCKKCCKLSSSTHATTNSTTFSVYNFAKHFAVIHGSNHAPVSSNPAPVSQPVEETSVIDSCASCTECSVSAKTIDDLNKELRELKTIHESQLQSDGKKCHFFDSPEKSTIF